MSAAIVTLFLPALVLAAIGVMLLVSSLRRPASAPVAGFVLRTLAALGLLGAAVVAGVGPWLPIPLLALVFGFVWVVGLLGAALLVEWAAKR